MWDFPVMDGVDFQDANRVHPLMQKRVERLIREFAKDPNIRKVILFGSRWNFDAIVPVISICTLKNMIRIRN